MRKEGSAFDLPIALGILAATEQLQPNGAAGSGTAPALDDYLVVGEPGLEGGVRPVRGALSIAVAGRRQGIKGVIVPAQNLAEAGVVDGIEVLGAALASPRSQEVPTRISSSSLSNLISLLIRASAKASSSDSKKVPSCFAIHHSAASREARK